MSWCCVIGENNTTSILLHDGHKLYIITQIHIKLDESMARQHLKSSTRSLHLTLVTKSHGHGHKWMAVPFVQYQSALPFLRYSNFKIWPWKSMVKAMHVVKGQSHIAGSATNRFTHFSFHINWPSHSSGTAFSKLYLENPQKSNVMTSFLWLMFNRYVHFLFCGNRIVLS